MIHGLAWQNCPTVAVERMWRRPYSTHPEDHQRPSHAMVRGFPVIVNGVGAMTPTSLARQPLGNSFGNKLWNSLKKMSMKVSCWWTGLLSPPYIGLHDHSALDSGRVAYLSVAVAASST